MKSSFLKVFAGHFQQYLKWLQRQKIQDKRKRQLSTRANHYLAYLSLSSSDHSRTFKTIEGKQKAWRNYRRFLRESMQYSDEGLGSAADELAFFHDFVERTADASARVHSVTKASAEASRTVVPLTRDSRGKRLSARPGERQKTSAKTGKKTSNSK